MAPVEVEDSWNGTVVPVVTVVVVTVRAMRDHDDGAKVNADRHLGLDPGGGKGKQDRGQQQRTTHGGLPKGRREEDWAEDMPAPISWPDGNLQELTRSDCPLGGTLQAGRRSESQADERRGGNVAESLRTCTAQEITERLKALPGWTFTDGAIRRTYVTDGWGHTLMVVNAIGFACEAADHHPDLAVSWARVGVALNTHTARGITDRDFETAELIERTVTWRPDNGAALTGPGKPLVK
jgi:4a-hydroxytetrahydrobiopterin dehydratase